MYAAIGESDRANMSSVDAYINARFFFIIRLLFYWNEKGNLTHPTNEVLK